MAIDDDALMQRRILERASAASGVDFSGYRRAVMTRRVQHRVLATNCDSRADYLRRLDTVPAEVERLIDALLIKTTGLFREPRTLERLGDALPGLIKIRVREGAVHLRAWVAGCSTGEEAFSIAAIMLHATRALTNPPSLRIFASDADPRALDLARQGVVRPRTSEPNIPPWAQHWFSDSAVGFKVAPELRAMTAFSFHDLLDERQPAPNDAVLASFDIVSCRNVLIYLEETYRRRVLDRLIAAVEPRGLLLLGDAESTPAEDEPGLARISLECPLYAKTE